MATIRELINVLGFKVDEGQLNKAEAKVEKFKKNLKRVGVAVGASILAIGTAAIKAASDMESLTAEFEVMLGSAENAQKMVKNLTEFAANTPFSLNNLAQSARTMLAFGISSEDVMGNLQMLGDIAGKDSDKLKSLTLAFSQIQSTGKLMGQDLLQLINAGFNPLKILSDKTGKSMGQLKEEMSNGAISADMVTEAFRLATSEGGLFFGNMKKQSMTFSGMISTMKDNITLVLVEIGSRLLPTLKTLVDKITKLFQGSLGDMIQEILKILDPVLTIVMQLVDVLVKNMLPIVQSLMKVLMPVLELISTLLEPVIAILDIVLDLFADIIDMVASDFGPLIEEINNLFKEMMPALLPLIRMFVQLIAFGLKLRIIFATFWFRIFAKGITLVLKLLQPLIRLVNLLLVPAFELLEKVLNRIISFIDGVFDKIIDGIVNGMTFIFDILNKVIETINEIPFIKNKLDPIDKDTIIQKLTAGDTTTTKTTNINLQNQITMTGKTGTTKQQLQQSAQAVFSIELRKLLIASGI